MRTKLAAVITATAVTLTPVTVANAQELSSQVETSSENLSSAFTGSSSGSSTGSSVPVPQRTESTVLNIIRDVLVSVGVWAGLGSFYGSVIAPHIPHFNIYDVLPFLRG